MALLAKKVPTPALDLALVSDRIARSCSTHVTNEFLGSNHSIFTPLKPAWFYMGHLKGNHFATP